MGGSMVSSKERLADTLLVHGIANELGQQAAKSPLWVRKPDKQRYVIPVYDLQALAIWPSNTDEQEIALHQSAADKLKQLAARALYYTGFDEGELTIRKERSGRYVIEAIRLHTYSSPHSERLITDAKLTRQAAEAQPDSPRAPLLLGMDPEFILLTAAGKVVSANRFLAQHGQVGYDRVTVRGRSDAHPLVELRPEPSSEPIGLVRNLRRSMWAASGLITDPSLRWIAGGMPIPGLPLGGHIHISGIRMCSSIVRALDNYLALPLVMLEHPSAAERRKRYGKLGDVREKAYGGFEYRTLPSMLLSPRITKGALALTKLIVMETDRFRGRFLDRLEVLKAYYAGDKAQLVPAVAAAWADIRSADGYAQYANYLEPLGEWIMARRSWNEQLDFRRAWRIPPYHES